MNDLLAKAAELKHTAAGRVFLEFLKERRDKHLKDLINIKDIDVLRNLQGRAQEDNDLINFLTSK